MKWVLAGLAVAAAGAKAGKRKSSVQPMLFALGSEPNYVGESYSEEILTCRERGCGNQASAYRRVVMLSSGDRADQIAARRAAELASVLLERVYRARLNSGKSVPARPISIRVKPVEEFEVMKHALRSAADPAQVKAMAAKLDFLRSDSDAKRGLGIHPIYLGVTSDESEILAAALRRVRDAPLLMVGEELVSVVLPPHWSFVLPLRDIALYPDQIIMCPVHTKFLAGKAGEGKPPITWANDGLAWIWDVVKGEFQRLKDPQTNEPFPWPTWPPWKS